jgi:dihydroorotate dehydrogenase
MYRLLRPLLFCLPPETAHYFTLNLLRFANRCKLLKIIYPTLPNQGLKIFGLSFKNRIGIGAGLDKNGDYIDALAALGVGFIEVGAVTPQPQFGNPKPRLFRLTKYHALINRMGFNNKGIDYLVTNLKRRKTDAIVGVNLGKNKDTPLEHAADDYNYCLTKIFPYADFATINISSPNTPDLRKLQTPQYLQELLVNIKNMRDELQKSFNKKLPLLVKIAPDLAADELRELLTIVAQVGLDGVIATNATFSRAGVTTDPVAQEVGGLSGAPIAEQSFAMLQAIHQQCPNIPVVSIGGVDSVAEGQRRFQAGAALIQVYTGLIYEGPQLLRKLIKL